VVTDFWMLLMRRQMRGEDGRVHLLDWEPITCPRGIPSTLGSRVLAATEAEVGGMARFFGPQVGFAPRNGQNDDRYEAQLFSGGIFSKERVGRPTGRREMLFSEYVAGWRPSFDQITSGIASPGILHACAWTHAGPPNLQETIAGAAAAARGLG
jgi:hypothetical protein